MESVPRPPAPLPAPGDPWVAPLWHTLALVGIFVGLTLAGAFFQSAATAQPGMVRHAGILPLYLSILLAEWALLYFVWKGGLRRRGVSLRALVGGRWARPVDLLRDLGLAALLWGIWKLIALLWDRLAGAGAAASISPLLPRGGAEILLWILVSITAGICEEVVFRGYFYRQFAALTRSRPAAMLLQAALFGIAHGYQGIGACARIAVYGLLFGLLAIWRRSLRPGILAHAGSDILAGILRL